MRCLRSLLLFLLSENESSEKDKDMEENAAIKIQAAFRGHLAREKVKKMKSSDLQEKTEENEWGGWLYTPENTKKSKSINLVVTVLFFLISEIWGSEITFVAVVKSVASMCLINMPLNPCLLKTSLRSWVLFILLPGLCLETLGFRVTKLEYLSFQRSQRLCDSTII